MAFVGGVEGSAGRTALRKATGFWIRPVGDRGVGSTFWGWNWFMLDTESRSGGNTCSLGLGRSCSIWFVNLPGDLDWAGGGDTKRFSFFVVFWVPWGMMLKEDTEELEGLLAAEVFWDARNCLGRVYVNVCVEGTLFCLCVADAGCFWCWWWMGKVADFPGPVLNNDSGGTEWDGWWICCCSNNTWLCSCFNWVASLYPKNKNRCNLYYRVLEQALGSTF